jgi:hypothetical protein
MAVIGGELGFDGRKRRGRCFGHILNLSAKALLFGSNPEAFENQLSGAAALSETEHDLWRRRGPVGKLHNLVVDIDRSDALSYLLIGGNIPPKYWPVILEAINYLRNRSPQSGLDKTPFEMLYGQRPNISAIRTLGTEVWYLLPSTKRKKLDEKSAKGILVGYEGNHTYKVLATNGTIVRSSNVHFDTEPAVKFLQKGIQKGTTSTGTQTSRCPLCQAQHLEDLRDMPQGNERRERPKRTKVQPETLDSEVGLAPETDDDATQSQEDAQTLTQQSEMVEENPELRYPTRNRQPNALHPDSQYMAYAFAALALAAKAETPHDSMEPSTYQEAKRSFFWPKWLKAMKEEHESLVENRTWSLVQPNPGMHVLRGKWVYKHKFGPNNEITRYKARLSRRNSYEG